MANELRETLSVAVESSDGFRPRFVHTRTSDLADTTPALDDRRLTVSTSDTAVTFRDITTQGVLVIENLSPTYSVKYGPESGGAMVPLGEIKPGEAHKLRLAGSVTLRVQAVTGAADVRLFGLDA